MIDYDKLLVKLRKFDKKDRSTFPYWFSHWAAYNLVAMKLGVWKPKWLLHDIEKPWLKLIWGDYKRVQKWHKHHNRHHIFYGRLHGLNKIDWLAAVIDWECSRYSKNAAQKTAREEIISILSQTDKYTMYEREEVKKNCLPITDYLKI
jgi:hypothetical protein